MKMKKSKILISVALLSVAYCAWTTGRIVTLESRLAELEASHRRLGRYAYEIGNALVRAETPQGLSGTQVAGLLLQEMEQDGLMQAAIHTDRVRSYLIRESESLRNSVDKAAQ
jgi:hypothetical protein